jgi:hypothetical protein
LLIAGAAYTISFEDPRERIRGGESSLMITFSVIGLIANANANANAAVRHQQVSSGQGLRWPE